MVISNSSTVLNIFLSGKSGRLTLGFSPYMPVMCAGMRMLPPRSVPQPRILAWHDNRTASPPVEPPGVKSLLNGWSVLPQSGFSVSHHCCESC